MTTIQNEIREVIEKLRSTRHDIEAIRAERIAAMGASPKSYQDRLTNAIEYLERASSEAEEALSHAS